MALDLAAVTPDPQQLARLRAMAALFGQGQMPPSVSDETPTAPTSTTSAPPAPTLQSAQPASQGTPGATQQPSAGLSTPGFVSKAAGSVPKFDDNRGATPATPATPPVMTEAEWDKQNAPPAHTPYNPPTGKQRLLHALGYGVASLGNPGIIAADVMKEGQNIEARKRGEEAYQAQVPAEQHAGYQRYIEGQQAPDKVTQLRQQIADSQAQEAERRAKAQGEQIVPFKLGDGTEIQIRQQDVPAMERTLKPTAVAKDAIIEDPTNPGQPKYAKQQPDGTYIDPDTQKPIEGAKPWEKQQNATLEQQLGTAVQAAIKKGVDPSHDPAVKQILSVYKQQHPEQPNFASVYPQIRGAEALEKPSTEYSNFNSNIAATKQNLAAAKTGDQLANSIAPLGTALMVVGAGGVHRINMTEINRAGDPGMGSLARRIDAALEKAKDGELPAETIKEMGQLVDMYGGVKYKAYLQQARSTAAYFKLDDPPVMTQDGDGFIPLSEALQHAKMSATKPGQPAKPGAPGSGGLPPGWH